MKEQIPLKVLLVVGISLVTGMFTVAISQEKVENVTRKNAISVNVAGTTPFIGITYERLLSDKINVEVGIGAVSVGVGIKYFPWPISDNKMVLHIGFSTNIFATPFDTFGDGDYSSISYVNVGLTYFGKEGLNFSIDVGPSLNYDLTFNETSFPIYGNLKIGYRF